MRQSLPVAFIMGLQGRVAASIWSATDDPSLMLWAMLGSALLGTVGFVWALSGASRGRA